MRRLGYNNPYLYLIPLLLLWLGTEAAWLAQVPVNVLNESVLHQNDVIDLYRTLHGQGPLAFIKAAATLQGPCSPLTATITAIALTLCPSGPWAWFAVQYLFAVLLVIGVERLGTLIYDKRTGLFAALTVISMLCIEGYLRSSYVDFSLAAILTWNYWAYLKSERFADNGYTALFTALVVIGMLAKWSYLPLQLSVFFIVIAFRSVRESTLTRANLLRAAIFIGSGALVAYLLYYRTGWQAIQLNYLTCKSFKPDWEHLTHISYYWHCLGKYWILLLQNDFLPLAGQLFLIAILFSCLQRRFRPSLKMFLLFILPNLLWIFLHFEFAVPRYLVAVLGFECLMIGALLAKASRWLSIPLLTLLLASKVIFLGGWLLPQSRLAQSSYDYLDSDALGVCDSVNAFRENDPFTLNRLLRIAMSGQQNWSSSYFFTSPPYRQPWLNHLEDEVLPLYTNDIASSNLITGPAPHFYAFTNEMRNGFCIRYNVNRCAAMQRCWNAEIDQCYTWSGLCQRVKRDDYAHAFIVLALTLNQRPHEGLPWPQTSRSNRFHSLEAKVSRDLGPDWRIRSFYAEQCSRVVKRSTMSKPFDLVILEHTN